MYFVSVFSVFVCPPFEIIKTEIVLKLCNDMNLNLECSLSNNVMSEKPGFLTQ